MRSRPATLLASTLALGASSAALLATRQARGDVSSWLAVGGGYGFQQNRTTSSFDSAAAFSYSVGAGTSPLQPLVLGWLVRGDTMVTLGTDVGAAVRGATGGFARGDWGIALDVGALWRSWGNDAYGTWPIQGVLTIGAPWGFQLALAAQVSSVAGGTQAEGFFATLEIDLLRLTVNRQGATERWWPNPAPAGGHPGDVPETPGPPGESPTASR